MSIASNSAFLLLTNLMPWCSICIIFIVSLLINAGKIICTELFIISPSNHPTYACFFVGFTGLWLPFWSHKRTRKGLPLRRFLSILCRCFLTAGEARRQVRYERVSSLKLAWQACRGVRHNASFCEPARARSDHATK